MSIRRRKIAARVARNEPLLLELLRRKSRLSRYIVSQVKKRVLAEDD